MDRQAQGVVQIIKNGKKLSPQVLTNAGGFGKRRETIGNPTQEFLHEQGSQLLRYLGKAFDAGKKHDLDRTDTFFGKSPLAIRMAGLVSPERDKGSFCSPTDERTSLASITIGSLKLEVHLSTSSPVPPVAPLAHPRKRVVSDFHPILCPAWR